MKLNFEEHISLKFDSYQKLTVDQRIKVYSAINQLNMIIDEVDDEDKILHIHNVPEDLVPRINEYNRTQRGPNSTPINITQICVNALQAKLDDLNKVWDDAADEMEDDLEDINGNILEAGDKVSFTMSGTAAHNNEEVSVTLEGIVTLEGETYCVQTDDNLFIIDSDLTDLRKMDEPYTMDDYEGK